MNKSRNLTLSSMVLVVTFLSAISFSMAAENQPAVPVKAEAPPPVQSPQPLAPAAAGNGNIQTSVFSIPTGKVGLIDIMRITEESTLGKQLKGRFKDKSTKLQAQLNAKQKQLEKQKSALQAKLPTLAPEQRGAKIKEYEKKVDEFKKTVNNAEKELLPLQEELTRTITMETMAACEAYAKEHGFALVTLKKDLFYVGSNYEQKDITSEVIKLMDEKKK
ncbi:outer membrane protein [Geobacter sp. OR-1]|uniref:OmpH family outer membrane protein n=1 Tax=Geobacter sp. OR-1 TaxID=1266765 RepID=UPI00054274FB|nr:OmpH family outer membrane protein [Geobacter sp. OR-1]GAM09913.1 outer membrane protein [Geobacter sp. OR-1]